MAKQKGKNKRIIPSQKGSPVPASPAFDAAYARIRGILSESRNRAYHAINSVMVLAYWEIGRTIVEVEQQGQERADYGRRLLSELSQRLRSDFGKGFDPSNLSMMRAFYLAYPIFDAVRQELSWTHYRILLRVENPAARSFYEKEAAESRWSIRELERQIGSLLFERLALSRDKEGVRALAEKGHEVMQPADLAKDPYVLEFAGLPQGERYLEADLEQALIDKLSEFLLELGKGFAFMGRQRRITLEGKHYFIDLVFYNRLTRCFVLLDLKVGPLTHQDLGQMQMHVNYYQREETGPDENPPIGIVLCTDKGRGVADVVRKRVPELIDYINSLHDKYLQLILVLAVDQYNRGDIVKEGEPTSP
jgi:predicted nuclease of restriction endonuclease-like (RecB) superfamily